MSFPQGSGERNSLSQSRFLRLQICIGWLLALAIGMGASTASATDDGRPVKIIFRGLQCYQETDEVGSDSPYLYVYAVNLRTGEFRSSGGAFIDVDEDELRQCTELSADWPEVMTANELVIVMCLKEDDTDDDYQYPHSSTNDAVIYMAYWDVLAMKKAYEKKLTDIVLAERANYQPTDEFRNRVAKALLETLPDTSSINYQDDTIGRSELRLTDDDISGKTIDKEIAILGDGGAYKIYFDVHSGNATLKPGLKGLGPMVGGAVKNLAGTWQSNLGQTEFQQDGYRIAGVVHFPDGAEGRLVAVMDGDQLHCRWVVANKDHGEAVLKIFPDGNKLVGTYQSLVNPDFKGEWTVTRDAKQSSSPPSKASLAGTWQSNLGPVDFQQDGYKVSGVVHFPDGVDGRVSATIDGDTLRCKWYVHDNHHGEAFLKIDPAGNRLAGTFQSSLDPNFKGEWTVTRDAKQSSSPPSKASLAGTWQSNLGPVDFQQDGYKVSGVVHFPDGVDGRVSATIDGDTLRCKWYVHDNHHGEAFLKIDPAGNRLAGTFQSSLDPNFKGEWTVTRGGQPPTPPMPPQQPKPGASLAGTWQSNLGGVDFQQDGFKVTGLVHFPNGVEGRVSATIDGDTLRCKWYVHDNHHGEAFLKISPDGRNLAGSYQSSVDPNFQGEWVLHR